MNKTKVKKYKVVLRDVSANFVSAEKFIKGSIEEIYVLKKNIRGRDNLFSFIYEALCF